MIMNDLKKCELYPNWREVVQDHSIWRGWIEAAAEDLDKAMEVAERRKKNELKQRREPASQEESQSSWKCNEQGCHFAGQSNTGLVKHIRQKHNSVAQNQQCCPHRGNMLHKQGLIKHTRFRRNKSPTQRTT